MQSAQRSFLKALGLFDLPERGRKKAAFPLHPNSGHLAISTSACSATSAVKFIYPFFKELSI